MTSLVVVPWPGAILDLPGPELLNLMVPEVERPAFTALCAEHLPVKESAAEESRGEKQTNSASGRSRPGREDRPMRRRLRRKSWRKGFVTSLMPWSGVRFHARGREAVERRRSGRPGLLFRRSTGRLGALDLRNGDARPVCILTGAGGLGSL